MLFVDVEGATAIGSRLVPDERSVDRELRFRRFFSETEPGLRRALVAAYGIDLGSDATADALSWAWKNFDKLSAMENPAGYLWRIGQSSTRDELRHRLRRAATPPSASTWPDHEFEPGLEAGLAALSHRQRAAVLLVHGYGYPLREAATQMDCRIRTLRNHLDRGMTKLRAAMGADDG